MGLNDNGAPSLMIKATRLKRGFHSFSTARPTGGPGAERVCVFDEIPSRGPLSGALLKRTHSILFNLFNCADDSVIIATISPSGNPSAQDSDVFSSGFSDLIVYLFFFLIIFCLYFFHIYRIFVKFS